MEPTYAYYEKVSEELEKIVLEVKDKEEARPLTNGEKQFLFPFMKLPVKCGKCHNQLVPLLDLVCDSFVEFLILLSSL